MSNPVGPKCRRGDEDNLLLFGAEVHLIERRRDVWVSVM
jgi:hypothetical protein